ncbi:FAD-dependent oxidoreductase [Blastopirellula sp. JC732]|uniref:FAD-dependent oxidoreductase n=1 Tax=Blastopirellula sediminis TaxID=2894196 RepID=A0A9X1SEZ1_9BACT|nr:FAD-dependent oxidoreductase [Blastopirellula sediminis]MCC9607925.1 FAD-dependent oxidoreductase [Blastopirellula sediminis]MCC9627282.1 FAD-dependent oxidoreductase [Blastopirellula sediminis]
MKPTAGSLLLLFALTSLASAAPREVQTDVCVYAATPSGIMAAIAVKKAGHSVVIVEPSRWVGGMLGAGLKPMQDCPNYAATGGMTHPLLKSLGQPAEGPRLTTAQLSPKQIREDFQALLDKHGIEVIFEHRIAKCTKQDAALQTASFDLAPFDAQGVPPAEPTKRDDLRVSAKIFIDAGYEGDLLAAAGCEYRVGREAATEFDESAAGVRPVVQKTQIDPYRTPGDPSSGLLPLLQVDHGLPIGAGDQYTQAYNYRYYTTADPENRLTIPVPAGYSAQDYELVGRYVAYLAEIEPDPKKLRDRLVGIWPGWRNSQEWNYQRASLISMAPLGISQEYASGDYAAKARVWKAHQDYLSGLYHFMKSDERVPQSYRDEISQLGLDGRFHPETGGWPHQLYIRIARRLKGRYVIAEHDVYNRTQIDDPIGLAQYGIDTYPSRRIVVKEGDETFVANEGNMFVGGNKGPTNVPYPISYRAITPQTDQCTNLLVPVCFSATHLGYASARMEPVFMIAGESSGIAAAQAIEEQLPVQQIDMQKFAAALNAAGQKLHWDPTVDKSESPSSPKLDFATLLKQCDQDQDSLVCAGEWSVGKPGFDWLFTFIDADNSGQIDEKEYTSFQDYKAQNPKWREVIQAKK